MLAVEGERKGKTMFGIVIVFGALFAVSVIQIKRNVFRNYA